MKDWSGTVLGKRVDVAADVVFVLTTISVAAEPLHSAALAARAAAKDRAAKRIKARRDATILRILKAYEQLYTAKAYLDEDMSPAEANRHMNFVHWLTEQM